MGPLSIDRNVYYCEMLLCKYIPHPQSHLIVLFIIGASYMAISINELSLVGFLKHPLKNNKQTKTIKIEINTYIITTL